MCVMYSGEYDACNVTLSVYPHRASLKTCLATEGIEPTTFGILVQSSFNLATRSCRFEYVARHTFGDLFAKAGCNFISGIAECFNCGNHQPETYIQYYMNMKVRGVVLVRLDSDMCCHYYTVHTEAVN